MAAALGRIYLVLTAAETVCLIACGLSFFEALTCTFSTVSTGGFSIYPASIATFTLPVQIVVFLQALQKRIGLSRRSLRWFTWPLLYTMTSSTKRKCGAGV